MFVPAWLMWCVLLLQIVSVALWLLKSGRGRDESLDERLNLLGDRLENLAQARAERLGERFHQEQQGQQERLRRLQLELAASLGRIREEAASRSVALEGCLREELAGLRHDIVERALASLAEHARADRQLLQSSLNAASEQLAQRVGELSGSVDGRLAQIGHQVNERLDEGFRKTNDTFVSVMARLATIDEAQKKIDGLTTNVVSLQELLGDKRSRGAYGEIQLEALVRNALPPDAYSFQASLPGGLRVDCLLRLPAPTGDVAVDAKFPLENYQRMYGDIGESERQQARTTFRSDLRRHIDSIADKYLIPGVTSDGAMMFVPAEAVFAEIHANFPDIVAHAQGRRIWIVSPTTLMAVLNTARAVLRDVETRRQVHVIQDALTRLAKDFQRFEERMGALARHIGQANRDVEDVHVSARKISAHFERIEAVRLDEDDEALPAPRPQPPI